MYFDPVNVMGFPQVFSLRCKHYQIEPSIVSKEEASSHSGADPGIWLGGSVDFFSKAWGMGAALRPPSGSRNPPEAPEF